MAIIFGIYHIAYIIAIGDIVRVEGYGVGGVWLQLGELLGM